ncbi:MAG: zinc metallopeptidase [Candidatus Portiera sp.]|nr:zinc metallopeptidase [Portiera sp.]
MLFLVIGILLLLSQAPALWAKHVLKKHSKPHSNLPGTGKQLFTHLKRKFKLKDLKLEEISSANSRNSISGDHFNPLTNTVYLSSQNFQGKSLTAVAVVTHEFSHALQFSEGSQLLVTRTQMAQLAALLNKIVSVILVGALIVSFIFPPILIIAGIGWILSFLFSVLIHIVTLPVELDASYNRALPILEEGGYLQPQDLDKVKQILAACAYTYVAQALASFITLLFIIFRRGRPF